MIVVFFLLLVVGLVGFSVVLTTDVGGWALAGFAALAVSGWLGLMGVSTDEADRYDADCAKAGGYVERGRSLRLCIDEKTGRIIRWPQREVEQ